MHFDCSDLQLVASYFAKRRSSAWEAKIALFCMLSAQKIATTFKLQLCKIIALAASELNSYATN